jgi:two-component system, NarL family, response regulator LiaR
MTITPLQQTRLTVLGDDELVVRGLATILAESPSLHLVTPQQRRAHPESVDLVLGDVSRCRDVETLQRLTEGVRPGRLVLFCWDLSPHTVSLGLHLGARGCLSKSLSAAELIDALRRIGRGEVVVRGVTEVAPAVEEAGLTTRETEVLALIASGASNQQIARLVRVSPNTVKSYVRAAYRKIGVDSRSRAVLWAVHHGVTGIVSPWTALSDVRPAAALRAAPAPATTRVPAARTRRAAGIGA